MSRIAKNPIKLPRGVEAALDSNKIVVKGTKGTLTMLLHDAVKVHVSEETITIVYDRNDKQQNQLAGTYRANIASMVAGVSEGFERKLSMVGVGYRAQAKDRYVSLSLGFSHPIEYSVPNGITIETPSQTEIVIKGSNKQQVGQVASDIRSFRPPEPYKGKGVRYLSEQIVKKEAKKK